MMVCVRCRMGVSGQAICATQRKGEPMQAAAKRAALLELESGREPFIVLEDK